MSGARGCPNWVLVQIGLLHYSVPPIVGGVEAVVGHQARLLAAAGHGVRLLAARGAPSPEADFYALPLADSRHARVLALKAELDAGCVPPDFEPLTANLLTALRPALTGLAVVIAHNVASLHKNLALTAALRQLSTEPDAPRLILWHHDLAWAAPHYAAELHPGAPWDLLRTAWPGVTQVVVSEVRRRELAALIGLTPERIHVIPNGIDQAAFLQLDSQAQALAADLGLARAQPLLLLPVRLTPRKNIELALRVLAALRAGSLPNARLLVTGPEGAHNPANAAYRARLAALRAELGLESAAHFVAEWPSAPLTDAAVAACYRLADALFVPSTQEGFGLPLLEAALARLPVFCADIPALRELGGGDATYFAPDADPAGVAALVAARLAADPVARLAQRVRAAYSWEQVYTRHLAPLLAEAAGPRKGAA
ncbi:MAG: glycosyltransferase family 4 protein [Anaerolineales bacterium]|nr:glycosyltransferase family 4 protein [Anaerolineales bacterium]